MDDIVELLRTVIATPHGVDIWTTTALRAADEIERLRSEVAIVLQEASIEAGENPTQHQGLCVAHPTEAYRD